jgi:lantibiotic modifying enzyme
VSDCLFAYTKRTLDNTLLYRWCHGAPGAIILLSTVLIRSSSPHNLFNLNSDFKRDIIESVCRGADLIYERGLLRKGLGICHGVAGSVYALISASSVLDSASDTRYLKKAVHLAHLATMAGKFVKDGEMRTLDRPWSLYEGLAGMCCAWSDVLKCLAEAPEKRQAKASGMPGYDDLLSL